MAKKYIIHQNAKGEIKLALRGPFGIKIPATGQNRKLFETFRTADSAETFVRDRELNRLKAKQAKRNAAAEAGTKYLYDSSLDENFSISYKFRIVHSGRVEDKPFYIQELGTRGWLPVKELYESGSKHRRRRKRYSSLTEAKIELMAIIQRLQDKADRKRQRMVIKVIDTKVYDHSQDNEIGAIA